MYPRTPRLTSALDPGWLRVGDMVFGGLFRRMVLRPLSLSGRSPREGRQRFAGVRKRQRPAAALALTS